MAEFSWAAAGDVGLGLLGGVSKGLQSMGAASIARSNARVANLARDGQNEVRRASRGLAATVRSLNNTRLAEAAGKQLDALVQSSVRTSDSFTRGNFEASIKDAESYGRAAAGAAAAGLGGGSIEAMSRLTLLTSERMKQNRQDTQADITYDQMQQTLGIMPQAYQRMDVSPILGNLDQGSNSSYGTNGFAGALLQGLLSKKDSLQTMLGSLSGDAKQAQPQAQEGAVSFPVNQSVVTGSPLAGFDFNATSYPVEQSVVNGVPLAPITLK